MTARNNIRFSAKNRLIYSLEAAEAELFDRSEAAEGPDTAHYFADDLFFRDAADHDGARVDGDFAVVAHYKGAVLGDLVGQLDVDLAVGFFVEVGLLKLDLVYGDGSVFGDVDPVAGLADHALDQDGVVVIESDDVAGLEVSRLDGDDDVAVVKGSAHRLAVDAQDGHKERRHEHRRGCDGGQQPWKRSFISVHQV